MAYQLPKPFLRRQRTPAGDPTPVNTGGVTASRVDPTVEAGRTGTLNYRGFLQTEDYNRDLAPPKSFAIYDRMYLSDPTIRATLSHLTAPLLSAKVEVRPATDDPVDIEQAAFIHSCIFEWMEYPWQLCLADTLRFLRHGVSVQEEVYENRQCDFSYRLPGQEEPVDVKRTGFTIRKLSPRLPRTIFRWLNNPLGELEIIQQYVYMGMDTQGNGGWQRIDIPASKCLVMVNEKQGDDWWGVSVLRSAYKPWKMLEAMQITTSIGYERFAVGTPIARMSQNASPGQRQAMLGILEELRVGERTAMVYSASDGVDCDMEGQSSGSQARAIWILKPDGSAPDTIPWMKHLESNIFTNILARFMDLGQKETGARATAEVQDDPFYHGLTSIANQVSEAWNRGPIKRLIDMNYPGVTKYPKLVFADIEPVDYIGLAKSVQALAAANFLTPDFDTEQWLRGTMNMPDKLVDQTHMVAAPADEGEETEKRQTPLGIIKYQVDAATNAAKAGQIKIVPHMPNLHPPSFTHLSEAGPVADALQRVVDRLAREADECVATSDVRGAAQLRAKDLGQLTTALRDVLLAEYPDEMATSRANLIAADLGAQAEAQIKRDCLNAIAATLEGAP